MAAIIVGELSRSYNPTVSEWGNPPRFAGELTTKRSGLPGLLIVSREPSELKHLSRAWKRN